MEQSAILSFAGSGPSPAKRESCYPNRDINRCSRWNSLFTPWEERSRMVTSLSGTTFQRLLCDIFPAWRNSWLTQRTAPPTVSGNPDRFSNRTSGKRFTALLFNIPQPTASKKHPGERKNISRSVYNPGRGQSGREFPVSGRFIPGH